MSREEKRKARILAGVIQDIHPYVQPSVCTGAIVSIHPTSNKAKTRSTTLDFVSFAPLDQTLVVVHQDFRLGNDPPFDPE